MPRIRWSPAPPDVGTVQRRNFINVQIDAVGVGLASAASPFLPVFLAHSGASNFEVGLLTSMPAFTGLFLALLVGRFLQSRRQIVPWFSAARLLVLSSYAATGLAAIFVPDAYLVRTVLLIWAVATLPQTMLSVCFSVVMNAVAGPTHRFQLMSRRWSILGLTTSLSVAVVGWLLEQLDFPVNYEVVFLGLSAGGLVSYYFSSRISLPEVEPPKIASQGSLRQRSKEYAALVWREQGFVRFAFKRFVFLSGVSLSAPLFPLYFVREVKASDAWIGTISFAQTFVLLIGYFLWTHVSRRGGSRSVLVATTLGLAIYPVLVSMTHQVQLIVVYAALAGIFQAGLDLVFFDELMRTVPPEYSATFVSLAQSLLYTSSLLSPLIGTWLAEYIGLGGGLVVSAALRLAGFALFALWKDSPAPQVDSAEENMESARISDELALAGAEEE